MKKQRKKQDPFARAFAMWTRRYNKHPEQFDATGSKSPASYGAACAAYFRQLLKELKKS